MDTTEDNDMPDDSSDLQEDVVQEDVDQEDVDQEDVDQEDVDQEDVTLEDESADDEAGPNGRCEDAAVTVTRAGAVRRDSSDPGKS